MEEKAGWKTTDVCVRARTWNWTHTHTHSHCMYAHTLTRTNAHTYSNPLPATTNHWSISYNPPPASATALNIQTNCPSSSARCKKRHKARADSWAGPRGWIRSGGSLCVAPRNRTIMSWPLSACQPALRCCLQVFAEEISGTAEALKSHSIRQMGIFGLSWMFSSLIFFSTLVYWSWMK